jgi:DNA-binding NtrC family response regulator
MREKGAALEREIKKVLIVDDEQDRQMLTEILKIDPGLDTIMMTGHTSTYTYNDIIKAGAADFIAKPFQLPELKAKMERIDRERKCCLQCEGTDSPLRG